MSVGRPSDAGGDARRGHRREDGSSAARRTRSRLADPSTPGSAQSRTDDPGSEAGRRDALRAGAGATGIRVSSDPGELDLDWIHAALSERAYWALGRSRDQVERSIRNSLCFAAYTSDGRQVGIARVITDEATFAWICDVFVDESARGQGIGQALLAAIVADPRLQDLRRMVLATRDAETLYARFGFEPLRSSSRWMERRQPHDRG